jgi:hypothetical protein
MSVYNCFAVNSLAFWHFHGMEEFFGSILISKSKYLANRHQWNQVLVQRTDVFQVRQFYLAYRASPDSVWTFTGRDGPTERRSRRGNFGCGLNLATSCCQIESPRREQQPAVTPLCEILVV